MTARASETANESIAGAFARGLVEPSWPALLLTIAVAAGAVRWCVTRVTADFFVAHHSWFRAGDGDLGMAATVQILARDSWEKGPRVLLVGDQALGDLFDEEGSGAGLVASDLGARVVDLTFPDQTIWESAALVDRTPRESEGVLVLDASPSRLREPAERLAELRTWPRLGFRSRAFDAELLRAELPCDSLYGDYFLDNERYLVKRLPYVLVNLLSAKPGPANEGPRPPARNETGRGNQLDVLARIVERVPRQSFLTLILVDMGERDLGDSGALEPDRGQIKALAKSDRVKWLRLERAEAGAGQGAGAEFNPESIGALRAAIESGLARGPK